MLMWFLSNALRERPDAVVVSGDIVNCGRPEEYQVARQILGSLNYPLYLIPGNHDDKALFLDTCSPLCPQLGSDANNMRYAVDDFATRLRLSTQPRRHFKRLADRRDH